MTPFLLFIIGILVVALIGCLIKISQLSHFAARWKETAKEYRVYYLAAVIAADEDGIEEVEEIAAGEGEL